MNYKIVFLFIFFHMTRTRNKIKLIGRIDFRPTNAINGMLEFILQNRPEIENKSQAIRVSIVRLYNELKEEVRGPSNGFTKHKGRM